jgi:diguanylate cyclase (GGDEF)-like protein
MLELAVPLRAGGRAIGALDLRRTEPLSEENVKVVELLAASVAVALQNAHLYQETQRLATTDPLTALSNYRHFHELLNLEVQRARRMAYPVGLIIMDLDHFKVVNDRHGHPVGDVALRQVAEQLRSRLRRTDVVGRLGGEEFGAILPGANRKEVGIVAEKIRRAVEELPPLEGGMTSETTRLTLSLGGTSLDSDTVDAELLISNADQALYEAKRNGRNQVCLWKE